MRTSIILFGLFIAPLALYPRSASAADPAVERMFKSKCGACHGDDGKGKTKQGEKMKIGDMTSAAWQKDFDIAKITSTIENGVSREKDGVKQEMKPLKEKLTPEQITQLAEYVKTLKK